MMYEKDLTYIQPLYSFISAVASINHTNYFTTVWLIGIEHPRYTDFIPDHYIVLLTGVLYKNFVGDIDI